jgi:hypothetical protein
MAGRINPGPVPAAGGKPNAGTIPPKSKWLFSFRFWREITHFGLSESDAKWFVSLLTKLTELSKYDVDEFRSNAGLRDQWRYHEINWGLKNVPITRSDCDWISRDYLENGEEYPFVQVQVSTARGRVVGFWDERDVFNIVLLDPLHNLQPSRDYDYKVTPCKPLGCEYSALVLSLEEVAASLKCDAACEGRDALTNIRKRQAPPTAVLVGLTDQNLEEANRAVEEGRAKSLADIFESGLAHASLQPPQLAPWPIDG